MIAALGEVVLKYLATIVFFLTSGVAMAEGLFLHSHSSVSDRFAILDETDQVAFLYLTQKGSQQPMRDAIAYMRVQPPKEVDWKAMAENGNPPILAEEFASDQAVITDVEESSFSFEWSADGNSAVLVFRGDPIALVAESEQIGFSKAVATPNKLTNPWDQDV